ncbi:MAG: hypothetical protein ACRDCT_21325 [Shewanella sp.]
MTSTHLHGKSLASHAEFMAEQIALANAPYTPRQQLPEPLVKPSMALPQHPEFIGSASPAELAKAWGRPEHTNKRNRWG